LHSAIKEVLFIGGLAKKNDKNCKEDFENRRNNLYLCSPFLTNKIEEIDEFFEILRY